MRLLPFAGVEAEGFAAEGVITDGVASGVSGWAGVQATETPSAAGTVPLLEIRKLSHCFLPPRQRRRAPGHPVLDRINLRVDSGEIVVLLGPSGCGKSTLLSLASGLNPRQQGQVSLEGEDILGPDPRLGLVFQQPALLPWLSVRGNVEFGLTLRHSERLSSSQRRERIQRSLRLVGLQINPETMPAHLSGGMAQRVALARVLVRNPRLLLLDEPFSALDAITRAEMGELLLRITEQTGAGMLIVTHDVDEAIQLGDRILLMRAKPGAIEREWIGRRAADEQERNALRSDILKKLSDILKSRSP
jgi:NitT/TauT family transport system ATP-binding protein